MSLSVEDDSEYTDRLNKLKDIIEDSFVQQKKVLKSKYTDQEAKMLFEKELQQRLKQFSFKYGPEENLFDQFISYFKEYDISDTGTVTQKQFEHVMYHKVGVYHPVNKAVLRQIFGKEGDGDENSKINYKQIAQDIVLPVEMKIQKSREKFEEMRVEQRVNEEKVILVDEEAIKQIIENDYDPEQDAKAFKEKTDDYASPFTNEGVLKNKPEFDQVKIAK